MSTTDWKGLHSIRKSFFVIRSSSLYRYRMLLLIPVFIFDPAGSRFSLLFVHSTHCLYLSPDRVFCCITTKLVYSNISSDLCTFLTLRKPLVTQQSLVEISRFVLGAGAVKLAASCRLTSFRYSPWIVFGELASIPMMKDSTVARVW